MNMKQKWLMLICAIAFTLSFLLAPWEITEGSVNYIRRSYTETAPLWSAPSVEHGTARLRIEVLMLEWAAIAILGTILFFIFQSLSHSSSQNSKITPKRESLPINISDNESGKRNEISDALNASPEDGTQKPLVSMHVFNKHIIDKLYFIQWFVLVCAAISGSAYIAHLRYLGDGTLGKTVSLAVAEAIGGAIVLLGIPLLLSFLFKKSKRYLICWSGLCLLFYLSYLGAQEKAKPMANFFSEINEQRADWKKNMTQQLQSKGYYDTDLAKAEKAMDAIKQKTDKLDDKAKRLGWAMLSVNDQMLLLAKIYDAARNQLMEAGGIDATTIHSLKQIENRKTLIVNFKDANEKILFYLHNIDSHIISALANIELTEQQQIEAIKIYKASARHDILVAIRELDREFSNDSSAIMNLLQKEWGKWKIHGKTVLFDDNAATREYSALLKRISANIEKGGELQNQLLK